MSINPRPAKSLNQRPVKQLDNTQSYSQPQPVLSQNIKPHAMSPVVPLVKGSPSQAPLTKNTFMGQISPVTTKSTNIPDTAENPISAFVVQLRDMVGAFAILSDDVIAQNAQMALGGFSADDRTVSFECADYLMSNMGFIFMGLVLDTNFKNAFKESLKVELQIDSQSPDIKAATRAKMQNPKQYKFNGSMVIGMTEFLPEVKDLLLRKMHASFSALDEFADEFETEIQHLTREQKIEYGFIFSNFMYLIRAFTHNDLFMSYVISVIEKVKAMTGNK